MSLRAGMDLPLSPDQAHYLTRVMRADEFLAFHCGAEFLCSIIAKNVRTGKLKAKVISKTKHLDPSGTWTMYFAPIKRIDDLVSAIVQMGAGRLAPVITERTVVRNVNWERVKRVIIEAAEQSGRNSLPELAPPVQFGDVDWNGVVFGDERVVQAGTEFSRALRGHYDPVGPRLRGDDISLMVGPEGGFSDAEFMALDTADAIGIGLGPTILRAEVAAVALIARTVNT